MIKYRRLGGLNDRNWFLTVCRLGSPRSRWQQLLSRWALSSWLPALCPEAKGPTLLTSLNLITFWRPPPPNIITPGGRASMYEFEEGVVIQCVTTRSCWNNCTTLGREGSQKTGFRNDETGLCQRSEHSRVAGPRKAGGSRFPKSEQYVKQAHGTTDNSYLYFYSNRYQWWRLKDVTRSSSK